MSRNGFELRFSSPAVERARARMHERDRARHDGNSGRVIGNRVDLVVPIDEFTAGPVMLKEELPQQWVSELVADRNEVHWTAIGPARIEICLEIESAFVRVQGEAHFSLQHLCVRCGQRDVSFEVPLVLDLRLVERAPDKEIDADFEEFNDGDDHAGMPLGNAADLEDIDIASYVGNSVDVGAVMREQLFLELPPHPNCESPGSTLGEPCLRSGGVKLDVELEHALEIDPRWAGLLTLKASLDDVPGRIEPSSAVVKPSSGAQPRARTEVTEIFEMPATMKQPAAKKAAAKTASKTTAPKKTASKTTASKKTPAKKTPAKKTPAKKTAPKKTASKKTAAKKMPAKKTASKKMPAKKTASKKMPAKKTAAKKTAAKKKATARR